MNKAAQDIQDKIDVLVKERDSLRGKYLIICGYCYYDYAPTFKEHRKINPVCNDMYWCRLRIYESEWERDDKGYWSYK